MFTRLGTNAVRTASRQTRNYATLRDIETRLKSIKNIEKITNTMKIVASTRLSKAERAKNTARVYDAADREVYKHAETAAVESEQPKNLLIVVSSDKGLCGSIHSSIAKATRKRIAELNNNVDVVAIGDKVRTQLNRTNADNLVLAFNGVGKETPTFTDAALISDEIYQLSDKYSNVEIFYNKFVSGVSFEPTIKPLFDAEAIEQSPALSQYETDQDAKVPETLSEFSLANAIYTSLADGYASEVSARRNAMDNASKNAGDMITRYSILYNRTRQAVITNELVDIITGASSLD
ncbi:ATP synthase gamma chain [Wickerhamomyces ciferrii]|uniref:ATP synthase subunit gamma n=1 Tax=Wickerhamomyces ciferrii (strain ATCC 14091 / BCRC 22168 / CBS 111 / JCM 3599 / NBRC 0793 / NRRL Y-1031 F-60-10) TaxID=1206466 RepID=K0KWF5_WICCF|nr:ATP synthase gamma chain [Wickerhamomyces ciferrii]CCH46302.1 ATP synthase gamma chain [Wickerhamomyces ciferrii]